MIHWRMVCQSDVTPPLRLKNTSVFESAVSAGGDNGGTKKTNNSKSEFTYGGAGLAG